MRYSIPVLFGLLACTPDENTGPTPAVCDADALVASPADGEGPEVTSKAITVTFEGNATEATVTAEGPDGPIAGTVSVEDGQVVFTPTEGWPENAEISWEATVCDQTAGGTFTTGTIEAATSPDELVGNSVAIDLSAATWISPEGGEEIFAQFFSGVLLLGVEAASDTELDLLGAGGTPVESGYQQDPCFATVDFEPVDFSDNPYFTVQSELMEMDVQGYPARIHDIEVSGAITAEGLFEGRLSGESDMRDYDAALGGDACGLLESYVGISCIPCRSDGAEKCIWIEAEDVTGGTVQGLTVVPNENPSECDDEDKPEQ